MPVAKFITPSGSVCLMTLREDRLTSLAPQELGILVPFEYGYQAGSAQPVKWDISYLYAELWTLREDETRLIIPFLPEFITDSFRPSALRLPLSAGMVAQLDRQRHAGDLQATLHIQATLTGTVRRDQIPDPARRKALEALGVEEEIFGPIRRSDNVEILVRQSLWEEEILPQWSLEELRALQVPSYGRHGPSTLGAHVDMEAVARSLQGATPGAALEDILGQFRGPTVGPVERS